MLKFSFVQALALHNVEYDHSAISGNTLFR